MATEQDYWNQMYANACDQNEVLSLRQQLAEAQAELEVERSRRFEGNRISSKEYNDSQKLVALMRDVVWETNKDLDQTKEEIESLRQQLADHIKCEVMLREFVKLLRDYIPASAVGNMTMQQALAATADLDGLILCHAEPCRDEGRCQYAIDHGAEGLGHCPEGKCCMPLYRAWEPK